MASFRRRLWLHAFFQINFVTSSFVSVNDRGETRTEGFSLLQTASATYGKTVSGSPEGVATEVKGLRDDLRGFKTELKSIFDKIIAKLGGKTTPSGPSPSPPPPASARRRDRRRRRSAKPTPRPSPAPKPPPPSPRPSPPAGKCAGYTVECPFCDCKNPGPINPSPEPGLKVWESYFLDAHNKLRCLHDVPPMKWNKAIASKAQQWASEEGPRYTRGKNPHSSHGFRKGVGGHWMVGENIAWQSRWSGYQAAEITATYSWYSEIKDTDNGRVRQGNTIPRSPMIGHYTQLVWKESVELGCGEHKKGQNDGFYVCMYGKAGNMQGQVTPNVGKIKVDPGKCSDPRAWAKSGR